MSVLYFKIRKKGQQGYLTGFAEAVETDGGQVLLKNRRIPLATFDAGRPVELAQSLGDLTLPVDPENGWAVWAYRVPVPAWWDRKSLPVAEAAAVGTA